MGNVVQVNILAVDDRPANLLALESFLQSSTVNVIKAKSGNEALARLLEMEFACALLDVNIPDIDGFELASIIRKDELTKHLPIIFVSGHRKGEGDVFKGYEMGAVDYLMKPLDPIIVRSKVNVFADLYRKEVARRQAEAELRKARDELERRVEERTFELTEQAEELARSNRELAQFAFVSSHDLKEPTRMVSMYIQLLKAEYGDQLDSQGKSYLDFVIEGSTRMIRLIDDLLTYSRAGQGKGENHHTVDCTTVVKAAIENLSAAIAESRAEITIGTLPNIQISEVQFLQVFQNLIENAIKFRGKNVPRIQIDAMEFQGEYQFRVRDNGIGIKSEYQSKIFEVFQRLHSREQFPGTGIGLAVCKKVIEVNGGKIWVESEQEEGATFVFTLPKVRRKS